jgi:6-phosphogluconolactonase (cycloisomerase 2 family)
LELVDVADSGGVNPVSLTNNDNWLVVLNAGGSGNITGFSIGKHGKLTPIPNSTLPLSNGGAGAAPGVGQISFTPDGKTLVVTEKSTNLIDTYWADDSGMGHLSTHPSSGITPFGFDVTRNGIVIVSEAFGGAPGASALSSYRVDEAELDVISPSVPTTQTSACWVVISKDGRYAYTTNAASGTISSYRIGRSGQIKLLEAVAGTTGAGSSPIDMAISDEGSFLYALSANAHSISIFQTQSNGSLAALGSIDVPAGAVGLAAR